VVIRAVLESATPQRLVVRVEEPNRVGALTYSSPESVWSTPPRTHDFIAVALAQYAAAAGHDLVVDGPVTGAQLENLDEYLQIWASWRPDLYRRVEIRSAEEVPVAGPPEERSAVMGFSGGVDASFALAAHVDATVGRLSRTIGRGVLVLGWDIKPGDEQGAARAEAAVRRSLAHYAVPSSVISTNWQQDYCPAWFMSFTSGLMGVLHTLSDQHGYAVHATDRSYSEELRIGPYGSHMMINHLLGHPGFPLISTGGTHSRIDRLAYLAHHPQLLADLRVCYQADAGGANCGRCEKCVRTQLEMRAVGIATDAVFPTPMQLADLERARAHRPSVLMHFEDVLRRLPADDPAVPALRQWLRDRRLEHAREAKLPLARVDELEGRLAQARAELGELGRRVTEAQQQAAAAEAELAAVHASRSWRWTAPLRRGQTA
jgi:hypothetical protein